MAYEENPTLLIVEDEKELADLFVAWLESEYDCWTAYDGRSALDQIDEEVDAVLLDRRMPGLSGDEVLEEMRERGFDCPVGMVTAVEPDFDIVEMGFDDYIVKPVSTDDLKDFVEDLLSLPEYERDLQRFFQLAAKRAAIETAKNEAELRRSKEYQALLKDLEEVRAAANANRDELMGRKPFAKLF